MDDDHDDDDVMTHCLRPAIFQWDHHLLLPQILRAHHFLTLGLSQMFPKGGRSNWGLKSISIYGTFGKPLEEYRRWATHTLKKGGTIPFPRGGRRWGGRFHGLIRITLSWGIIRKGSRLFWKGWQNWSRGNINKELQPSGAWWWSIMEIKVKMLLLLKNFKE